MTEPTTNADVAGNVDSNLTGQAADLSAGATSEVQQTATAESLSREIEELKNQLTQSKDELLRAKAEVENIRRRSYEEASKARKFAIESFTESLLPVADSLEAAASDASGSLETLKKGVDLTLGQLRAAFERAQVIAVAPVAGDKFDPLLHQAISTIASTAQPPNTVVGLLQKGYKIAERTLRPALVTVASAG